MASAKRSIAPCANRESSDAVTLRRPSARPDEERIPCRIGPRGDDRRGSSWPRVLADLTHQARSRCLTLGHCTRHGRRIGYGKAKVLIGR